MVANLIVKNRNTALLTSLQIDLPEEVDLMNLEYIGLTPNDPLDALYTCEGDEDKFYYLNHKVVESLLKIKEHTIDELRDKNNNLTKLDELFS